MDNLWIRSAQAGRGCPHGPWGYLCEAKPFAMHPEALSIADFDYELPPDRIALHPLTERDASRLLVWDGKGFADTTYRDIPDRLAAGTRMVFNDTRVTDARLLFPVSATRSVEVFLLEPADGGAMLAESLGRGTPATCRCLVGGAARWKAGRPLEKHITLATGQCRLLAWNEGRDGDAFRIRLEWDAPDTPLVDILHRAGQVPLPPYLRRAPTAGDADRYQTVYAAREGSVAAPTAGLHFTPAVLDRLDQKGVHRHFVTLHVGAGTFRPVKAERMADHPMHGEFAEVGRDLLDRLLAATGPVVAVGTTSLRTLESLYWMGRKVMVDPGLPAAGLATGQWDPYREPSGTQPKAGEALRALADWMDRAGMTRLVTRTHLLIAPGYRFRVVEGLVTNFHQPRSTLLLLIAAWMGDAWRAMYRHALDGGYRFLSYGDGCLLGPPLKGPADA